MGLKRQQDERTITLSIEENVTVPSSGPYSVRLDEVPESSHGVAVRRVGAMVKTGTGSGSCASGGVYSGLTTKHYKVQIDTAGDVGAATFKWSNTGGATWNGVLIPIPDTSSIELELGLTVRFGIGIGTDFNLNDVWTFDAEHWTEVSYVPTASMEFEPDYTTGDILFHSADAGKTVVVNYEGRGSLCDAESVNQCVDVLNAGEVAWRDEDTSGVAVRKAVGISGSGVFQLASNDDPTKFAVGFVKVSHATEGEVVTFGPLDGFAGLTPGARYYLGMAGEITVSEPGYSGAVAQVVGVARSATRLFVSVNLGFSIVP